MLCYVLAQFVDLLGKELRYWPSFLNQITSSDSLERQMRQTKNKLAHFPANEATRSSLNKRPFLATTAQNNGDLPRQLPRLLANWEIRPKRLWARETRRPNHPKTWMKQPANFGMFYGWSDSRKEADNGTLLSLLRTTLKGAKNDSNALKPLKHQ